MDLSGKNVVITGGSQGIGEAMAEEFAKRGSKVLVAARSADKLEIVAKRIGGEYLVADLGNDDDVDGFVAAAIDKLGHIDVFVNNAGVETLERFVDVDRQRIRDLARLNFEAPMMLSRDVLPHMVGRGSGHVVNLSSLAGTIAWPGLAAYAGSKAGVTNFTETLRMEFADTDIGFTVVAPGPVDTDMWDRLESEEGSYVAPALKRFRRLGYLPKLKPAKVARQIVDAVAKGKPHVRPAVRYQTYHVLNNAPRRIVQLAMTGVKLEPPTA